MGERIMNRSVTQSSNEECFNQDQLRRMLDGEFGQADSASEVLHIENCRSCRERLEALSGELDDWQQASELRITHAHETEHRDRAEDWTDALSKKLLEPARHPEMLGRIGRYDIERMLGAGGMGIVFRGFDSELQRVVAIKALAPSLAFHGAARHRFAKEARAAAAVIHDDVVPIYDVQTQRDIPFLVMRFIPGESLQARIDREGPLELKQILRIGKQLMAGLAAAHAQGLIHRDVKPANVLIEEGIDRALLTDFGLAQSIEEAQVTASGAIPGTPSYMSPEQSRGEKLTASSDIYSAGSVLYAMCTGRPPFRADSPWQILKLIAEADPKPIRELNADIPQWLANIIDKTMAKRPEDRFSSASDVANLLEKCLAHVQQPLNFELPTEVITLGRKSSASTKRYSTGVVRAMLIGIGSLCVFAALWGTLSRSSTIPGAKVIEPSALASRDGQLSVHNTAPGTSTGTNSQLTNSQRVGRNFASPALQPEDPIFEQLSRPIDINIMNAAFSEAIATVLGDIPFELSLTASELETRRANGLEPIEEVRVTCRGGGTRQQILQRILQAESLGYIVHPSRIELASQEACIARPSVRAYNLSYITDEETEALALVESLRTMLRMEDGSSPDLNLHGAVLLVRGTEQIHERLIVLLAAWKENPANSNIPASIGDGIERR